MSLKLLIDSADPEVWKELLPTGLFSGITTNHLNWDWNFGSNLQNPTYYLDPGLNEITLVLEDDVSLPFGFKNILAHIMGELDEIIEKDINDLWPIDTTLNYRKNNKIIF